MPRSIYNLGLRQLCESKRVCIEDLAAITKTHRDSIYKWSRGERPAPRLETKLAEFFKLSVEELRIKVGLEGGES